LFVFWIYPGLVFPRSSWLPVWQIRVADFHGFFPFFRNSDKYFLESRADFISLILSA
jgi:hypothetical protein